MTVSVIFYFDNLLFTLKTNINRLLVVKYEHYKANLGSTRLD